MAVFTGNDGSFSFGGNAQARCTAWTVESSTNVLDRSELGDVAIRNLVGLKGYTGTASLIYYSDDTKISALLEKVFRTGETEITQIDFIWGGKSVRLNGIITGATISISAGELVTAEVSFTADGDITAAGTTV